MEDGTAGWNRNISPVGYADEAFQEEYGDEEDLEDLDSEDYNMNGMNSDLVGYSEPKAVGGIYALFDTVLNKPSSIKVSNVNKLEMGDVGITVREALKIGALADTFQHPVFAKFFYGLAGITTDSSMSKDGWFTELFVTSKKYSQKASQASINNLPQNNGKKWKMFNKNQQATQEQV